MGTNLFCEGKGGNASIFLYGAHKRLLVCEPCLEKKLKVGKHIHLEEDGWWCWPQSAIHEEIRRETQIEGAKSEEISKTE